MLAISAIEQKLQRVIGGILFTFFFQNNIFCLLITCQI